MGSDPAVRLDVAGWTSSSPASPAVRSAALKLSSTLSGRWMVQTLSWASTASPIVDPVTQWFGNGLGQKGSTSKIGASFTPSAAD
jgi:hypothetical protein